MVDSVNTNAGALTGLQFLGQTNRSNAATRNQISSGLRISGARDGAATFAIAQQQRAEGAGLRAVGDSVARGQSTADVALAAGGEVSSLLLQLRETAVAASDEGLDDASRQALNEQFTVLRDQITTTVNGAEFNGTNPLAPGGGDIAAITNADGTETLSVSNQDFSLGGGTVSLGAGQEIATAADAQSAVAAIDASLSAVNASLSSIGAGAERLEQVETFNRTLADTNEVGIGNLVDANLAEADAELEAGQVREQLGVLALNIANRQPQSILSLFNNG
ncbi:flagellin [Eilatimonas milleporae]|uniref:Flagellin n=1 Tax=Eilatimonas milleporae TaxID=911205 RepID=A0A3M0CUU6_9PROT|nr:flagellin [Eilatimonas milleporae]RMB12300.1 flagellin [Eilatimonas milleporae]